MNLNLERICDQLWPAIAPRAVLDGIGPLTAQVNEDVYNDLLVVRVWSMRGVDWSAPRPRLLATVEFKGIELHVAAIRGRAEVVDLLVERLRNALPVNIGRLQLFPTEDWV